MPSGAAARALERWMRTTARTYSPMAARRRALERELILGARSRATASRAPESPRPMTQKLLAELARRLVEIHGQNDHQRLLEPSEQMILLDQFGGLEAELEAYRARAPHGSSRASAPWPCARPSGPARAPRARRFQQAELRAAAPASRAGRLLPEREILRHAEGLKQELGALVDELLEADGALLDRLRRAERIVCGWRERVGALAGPAGELAEAGAHLEEAARALRSLVDRLEADPARLEAVEERLAELERLSAKYGATRPASARWRASSRPRSRRSRPTRRASMAWPRRSPARAARSWPRAETCAVRARR